jgi:hypothetical protein
VTTTVRPSIDGLGGISAASSKNTVDLGQRHLDLGSDVAGAAMAGSLRCVVGEGLGGKRETMSGRGEGRQ